MDTGLFEMKCPDLVNKSIPTRMDTGLFEMNGSDLVNKSIPTRMDTGIFKTKSAVFFCFFLSFQVQQFRMISTAAVWLGPANHKHWE